MMGRVRRLAAVGVVGALVAVTLLASPFAPDGLASHAGTPTSVSYLPNITRMRGGPDGWQTPFIVQNIGTASTDVEMELYSFSGALLKTRLVRGLRPGTSVFHDPNSDAELPAGGQFSVVIRSFGSPVVAVVNQHQNVSNQVRQEAFSYSGMSSGSTVVFLPYVAKFVAGWMTTFIMQNLGTSTATVTAKLISSDDSAPSQYGKSTSNRAFYLQMRAQKTSDGKTSVPVAQAWATDGKRLILRSIAESLGGERFAALPNRELRVPAGIRQLETRLIIVNNGHNMEWRQWQELLTLDDVCWAHHGVRPAIVLSGVHRELGLVNLPRIPELVEQIRKRIVCYKEVPGHDRREAKEALRLLLERDCPELLERRALDHARLLYELLTDPLFDRWRTKTIGSADLVEVARRMAALHRAHRDRSAEAVIRSAVERYRKSQTAPDETSAAELARATRGLQASGAAHA